MLIQDIPTPAILVDISRIQNNIRQMATKANKNGVSLRPHIKTHKCVEIGDLQKKEGAEGITVSTLKEADVFSNHGFDDITYAIPLSTDKVGIVTTLNRSFTLNVIVDDSYTLEKLSNSAGKKQREINVLVKVDCGYHRCGVEPSDTFSLRLVQEVHKHKWLNFKGILTHAGHAYSATSASMIQDIALQEQEKMIMFAEKLREKDSALEPEIVSIGSTPTLTLVDTIQKGITEIRPGNYVYFDYTQVKLGVCRADQCSFSVLTSIVGKYSERLVIDAGATALSKDAGPIHIEPDCGYGKFYLDYKTGTLDSASTITGFSQEHGKVKFEKDSVLANKSFDEKLRVLPNHSCLTNNLFDEIYVVDGEKVVDKWEIHHGHRSSNQWNY